MGQPLRHGATASQEAGLNLAQWAALLAWRPAYHRQPPRLTPLTPEASTRRYLRATDPAGSVVLQLRRAPIPANDPFLRLQHWFATAGWPVVRVIACFFEVGLVVLEDLGDTYLSPAAGGTTEADMAASNRAASAGVSAADLAAAGAATDSGAAAESGLATEAWPPPPGVPTTPALAPASSAADLSHAAESGLAAPSGLGAGVRRAALNLAVAKAATGAAADSGRGAESATGGYAQAIDLLAQLHRLDPTTAPLAPPFDARLFATELRLFLDTFTTLTGWRGTARAVAVFDPLCDELARLPRVLCHRDYHRRNLLATGAGVRVIDFQDARLGPRAYDLASLLEDPYTTLPAIERQRLRDRYAAQAGAEVAAYPLVACQRLVKAAGSYCNQRVAFANPSYLPYVAPALQRAQAAARDLTSDHPDLAPLLDELVTIWGQKG